MPGGLTWPGSRQLKGLTMFKRTGKKLIGSLWYIKNRQLGRISVLADLILDCEAGFAYRYWCPLCKTRLLTIDKIMRSRKQSLTGGMDKLTSEDE